MPEVKSRLPFALKALSFSTAISIGGVVQTAGYRRIDDVSLKECMVQHVGKVPIVTYGDASRCEDIKRGREFRQSEEYDMSGDLRKIAGIGGLQPEIFRGDYLMFQQIGGTCSLSCAAAILSNISLNYCGPAIDPYVLSDLITAKRPGGHDVLDKSADHVDDLNVNPLQLAYLNGEIPFNPDVGFRVDYVPDTDIPRDPDAFLALIASMLQDPDLHIILNSRVSDKVEASSRYHAVVVVGASAADCEKDPYLLAADPTGANFIGSENFSAVQTEWYPICQNGFTTLIPLNERTMNLVRSLMIIKAEKR